MIISFKDEGTRDIFLGLDTRLARKTCPTLLWPTAYRKLEALHKAREVGELREPPGNRLEQLKGDRRGEYSMRLNNQYRLCFCWDGAWPEDVEIVDYH